MRIEKQRKFVDAVRSPISRLTCHKIGVAPRYTQLHASRKLIELPKPQLVRTALEPGTPFHSLLIRAGHATALNQWLKIDTNSLDEANSPLFLVEDFIFEVLGGKSPNPASIQETAARLLPTLDPYFTHQKVTSLTRTPDHYVEAIKTLCALSFSFSSVTDMLVWLRNSPDFDQPFDLARLEENFRELRTEVNEVLGSALAPNRDLPDADKKAQYESRAQNAIATFDELFGKVGAWVQATKPSTVPLPSLGEDLWANQEAREFLFCFRRWEAAVNVLSLEREMEGFSARMAHQSFVRALRGGITLDEIRQKIVPWRTLLEAAGRAFDHILAKRSLLVHSPEVIPIEVSKILLLPYQMTAIGEIADWLYEHFRPLVVREGLTQEIAVRRQIAITFQAEGWITKSLTSPREEMNLEEAREILRQGQKLIDQVMAIVEKISP